MNKTENKTEQAIGFALSAHEGAKRKGGSIPYILHPLEAAAIAAQLTADDDVIAAAALHDVLEDTAQTAEDLRARFGDRVTALVISSSEDKHRERPAHETWLTRKQETLNHLKTASRDEKIVSFADKLSNLRSTLNDYDALGEPFWERFQQKDPDMHVWYYTGVYEACAELDYSVLYMEYDRLLRMLRSMVREYKEFGGHDDNALEILAVPGDEKWVFRTKHSNDVFSMTNDEFHAFVAMLRSGS